MRNYELLQNYTINNRIMYEPNIIIETVNQGTFVFSILHNTFFSLDIFRIRRYIDGKYIMLEDNIDLCYDDLEFYL